MTHDIKNMTNYTEWFVMRMIALLIYQKKKKNIFWKHLKIIKKKKTKWAIWNTEKTKISYQINEFSEKFNDKSKFLKTEQEEMKKQMKATSFW